jgi:hypothetical protein
LLLRFAKNDTRIFHNDVADATKFATSGIPNSPRRDLCL